MLLAALVGELFSRYGFILTVSGVFAFDQAPSGAVASPL